VAPRPHGQPAGGLAFEDDRPDTLAALEQGLRAWYEEQGIEVEDA
jgi:hypothetical protein